MKTLKNHFLLSQVVKFWKESISGGANHFVNIFQAAGWSTPPESQVLPATRATAPGQVQQWEGGAGAAHYCRMCCNEHERGDRVQSVCTIENILGARLRGYRKPSFPLTLTKVPLVIFSISARSFSFWWWTGKAWLYQLLTGTQFLVF